MGRFSNGSKGLPMAGSAALKIKLLGSDCVACNLLRDLVLTALDALYVGNFIIDLVTNAQELDRWLEGKSSPGLVVNGQLVMADPAPRLEDVIAALEPVIHA